MKKILILAVLLYSAVAKLYAQTCNTCTDGIIAQCPTGLPHDVRNVYMCFRDVPTLGFAEGTDCELAITNNNKSSFKPHKEVVIHKEVNLILPIVAGKSILIGLSAGGNTPTGFIPLDKVKTLTFQLQGGINNFDYFICPTGSCPTLPIVSVPGQNFPGFVGQFQIEFKDSPNLYNSASRPDEIWEISVAANEYDHPTQTPYNGVSAGLAIPTPGKAHAYVKYGGTKGVLDKPLIFVDGIDFSRENYIDESIVTSGTTIEAKTIRHGTTGWDVFVTGREEAHIDATTGQVETFNLYPTELQKLQNAGYDLIMLDFADGATYMEKNAELLIKLLKRVKDKSSDIVVVGASMGGQISRYALTKMESKKENHCVTHYVSFDSPNQGANIPLFMQGLAWALYDYQINGQPAVADSWRALNLPATLQLLTEPFQSSVAAGKITLSNSPQATGFVSGNNYAMRNNFVNKLEQQGSYSSNARNIAISCGSINGTPQVGLGAVGGEKMYGVSLEAKFAKIVPRITVSSMGLFTVNGNSNPNIQFGQFQKGGGSIGTSQYTLNPTNTIFGMVLPDIAATAAELNANCFKNKFPILKRYFAQAASNTTFPIMDGAPGGFRDDLLRLVDEYVSIAEKLIANDKKINVVKNPDPPLFKTSFISTVSALDLKNIGLFANLLPLDQKFLFKNKQMPFERFYAPTDNLSHVELDESMVSTFLLPQLQNFNIDNRGDLKTTYNYGFQRNRMTDIKVTSTGKLMINEVGATGYVSAGLNIGQNADFDVFTSDCGPIVVENGGELRLGSATNTTKSGNLHINRNTTLTLNAGLNGKINISNTSKLFVKTDAKLVIEGGIVSLKNGGAIVIESGGKAYFNAGTTELRSNSKIIIQAGGELYIKASVTNNLFNNSQIVVETGGKLILESPNTVTFNGDGSGTPIIIKGELVANTPVRMLNDAHFRFEVGNTVTVPQGGTLNIQGSAQTTRMIEIVTNAKIALNQRSIDFKQGKINYFQNATIDLKSPDQVRFNYINAEEIGKTSHSARVLLLDAPNIVALGNSNFRKFYAAVEAKKQTQGYIRATSCSFVFNKYGIDATEVNYVNVGNSTFTENHIGLRGNNTASYYVNSSTFVNNDYGMDLKSTSTPSYLQVGNSQIRENHYIGVQLRAIPYAIFTNTLIENHNGAFAKELFDSEQIIPTLYDYDFHCYDNVPNFDSRCRGVSATDDCNIIMQEGTIVRNNSIGVFSEGSTNNNSSISLDCATFDDNGAGIKGLYTEILADVYSVVPHTSNFTRPNNFILGKGLYLFDMGYYFKNLPKGDILLTGNFWNANNQGLAPDPSTMNFFSQAPGGGVNYNVECESCQKLGNCLPYITEPEATEENKDCKLFGLVGDDSEKIFKTDFSKTFAPECNCEQVIESGYQGVPTSVHAQFRAAYYAMRTDARNMERVLEAFTQIAQLPIAEGGEGGKLCEQYIRYARAIVDIYPDENGHFGSKIQKAPTSSIKIYPNPATERINISLPKGNFDISIMDNQGRSVFKMNSESETSINTSNWLSGIYHVSLKNTATGEQSVQKVVVMKKD